MMKSNVMRLCWKLLVNEECMFGTGQLPKFGDDAYNTGRHWLIPTSEVSLTNMFRNQEVVDYEMPWRLTAHTPCFRSEAGSAGRDTKGMSSESEMMEVSVKLISNASGELMVGPTVIPMQVWPVDDDLIMLKLKFGSKAFSVMET